MSRMIRTGLLITILCMSGLWLVGCGASANLGLKFEPQNVTTHEVTVNVTKDFRFEQPTVNKLREEETSTTITTVYDRQIEGVDENGWATAKVTLTGLKVKVLKSGNVEVDYDSAAPEAAGNPLNKLLGQSYTIQLNAAGEVKPLDLNTVSVAGISGTEGRIAKRMFEAEEVVRRHQVLALPSEPAELSVGKSWSTVVPSPPGLLSSKSYKKTYTLSDIETRDNHKVAVVKMNAEESAVAAEGAKASQGLGIFSKMMDNEDEFTGSMVLDLETGTVLSYNETLISTYLAQEMNPEATPEQGPDTLRIRFIQKVDQKLVK